MSIFSFDENMKRFGCIIAGYILIVGLLVCMINAVYMNNLGTGMIDDRTRYREMPDNIKICNLGSSHGYYGFDYESFSEYESFNFAFISQYPSYDYRLLKHYRQHLAAGGFVFVPVSYFALYGLPEEEAEDFESKNKRYYTILPPWMIKEYDLKTDLYVGRFASLSAGEELIPVLLGDVPSESAEYKEELLRIEKMTADEIDVKEDAQKAYLRHVVTDRVDEQGRMIHNEEEIQALYDIITLCKNQGVTPILLTTPLLREYSDALDAGSPDFLADFKGIVEQIVSDTGVEYYDYSRDARFCDDYSVFMNADHLNRKGAKKFTRILLKEVVVDRLQ